MSLITDPTHARDIYQQAAARGICLANFCTENQRTTEAILRAAHLFAQTHGLPSVPVVLSATANYPIEPQLQHYTGVADARMGLAALLADVDTFLSEDSPYRDVAVMLHLDHALPGYEEEIIPRCLDRFATIMYDCSYFPFDENIRRTAQFVQQHGHQVMVEGCVDEIIQAEDAATEQGHLTDPAQAERFLAATGVDLLVPNLGTEHRSTAASAHYDGALAQQISQRTGPRLVLHGSSSLADADLPRLAGDGIVKVNVWSIFERLGGQAVAGHVLHNLGNMLAASDIAILQAEGMLGPRFSDPGFVEALCQGAVGPKGWALVERSRRAVWQEAVTARMVFYLEQFGYARWG
jgi:fructose-bisphosphate aldolase class II